MASNRQLALSKLKSLKQTYFNAIAELEMRAERAADTGDNTLSARALPT